MNKKYIFLFILFFLFVFSNIVSQEKDLNLYVISTLQEYPRDGTHQYYWKDIPGWYGNTRDLYYENKLFAKGDIYKRCYCCGLTFEVFFRAYEKYCKDNNKKFLINNLSYYNLEKFRKYWFGAFGNKRTLVDAVIKYKLGKKIKNFKEAKKGDFVQFWRNNGSGHSVIFISWIKNYNNKIIGLKYWSTQGSTNGINYNIEYFYGKNGIDPNQIYIARIIIK